MQIMFPGCIHDRFHVSALPEEMNRYYGPGAWCDSLLSAPTLMLKVLMSGSTNQFQSEELNHLCRGYKTY